MNQFIGMGQGELSGKGIFQKIKSLISPKETHIVEKPIVLLERETLDAGIKDLWQLVKDDVDIVDTIGQGDNQKHVRLRKLPKSTASGKSGFMELRLGSKKSVEAGDWDFASVAENDHMVHIQLDSEGEIFSIGVGRQKDQLEYAMGSTEYQSKNTLYLRPDARWARGIDSVIDIASSSGHEGNSDAQYERATAVLNPIISVLLSRTNISQKIDGMKKTIEL